MKKIHARHELILYAFSGMGINMLNIMISSYLCSALLIGGFGKAAIPFQTMAQRDLVIPAVWAIFVLAAKIIDGVIDIPMAAFSDKLRTRWGRRRPAILIGLVMVVAAYALFLVIPDSRSGSVINTIYFGLLLCVFYSFYTLTMVTYYATFTEIVNTQQERAFLSDTKAVFDIVYFILGYVVVRLLLNSMNIRLVSLIVLPVSLTMLIPLIMIKEPDLRMAGADELRTVGFTESLKYTFKNKNFILWLSVYSFMTFGVQLFLAGINEYFSYVGINMIYVMGIAFIPVPLTLMLYNKILRKRGFGFAFRYVLITFSVGMLYMFVISLLGQGTVKAVLSVSCGLVCSLALGALFSVAYSVPAQLAADEEKKNGISNSAMYFAVQGLFSGVATGIGTGLVLTALKGSENANSGMIRFITLIAAAGTVIAVFLTLLLPESIRNSGKLNEMRK